MKRLLLLSLLFASSVLHSQDRAGELITQLSTQIASWKGYSVEFKVNIQSDKESVLGSYVVSGDKFCMKTADREIRFDGRVKYEIVHSDREVLIDNMAVDRGTIMGNPTKVFEFSDELFLRSYKGRVTVGGRKCEQVVLTPRKAKGELIDQVVLTLDSATSLPVQIVYRISNTDEPATIDIIKIGPMVNIAPAEFIFDKTKYKGYELIDFR